jgi:hypothetical protein
MAIDLLSFKTLLRLSGEGRLTGDALVLGRQNFLTAGSGDKRMQRQLPIYQQMLVEAGFDIALDKIIDPDGFCDSFFRILGFNRIDYMDVSGYEGANVIHDLNKPLPARLIGRYDFIFDGGTTEHVFDVPQAFENYDLALRTGGSLLAVNPANNWPGHGFYQFGPEVVWSYWRDVKNYKVHQCTINAMRDWYSRKQIVIAPPEARAMQRDHKLRSQLGDGIQLLVYLVEKSKETVRRSSAQQSDYRAQWQRG